MTPVTAPADPTRVGSKRIVAAVIDIGIEALVLAVLFLVLAQDYERYSVVSGTYVQGRELQGGGAVAVYAFALLYNIGVFLVWRGLTGNTVGTLAMRIAVVDEAGRPPGIVRAIVRSGAGVVDYLPCCAPAVGLITMFTSTAHRRVGDMAAKTYVVDAAGRDEPLVIGRSTNRSTTGSTGRSTGRSTDGADPASAPASEGTITPESEPEWDPHRNAFIQYDTKNEQWMVFDEDARQWRLAD